MSSKSRRKNITVIEKLAEQPYQFSFKQAVRLLERSNHYNNQVDNTPVHAVGRFMPPASECIRFNSHQSFSFTAGEIASVKHSDSTSKQWVMDVNFIGLTGTHGVLPYHYTETVLKRLKLKDASMKAFFDIFNHRTTSLFFQSSIKYNVPLEYERTRLKNKNDKDNFTKMLLSIVGLGTSHLNERLYTKDESLLFYAGLLQSSVRSSSGLKQILESHFNLPIEIKEFVGEWQDLIDDVRSRFSTPSAPAQNNQLGRNVMIGKRGWFVQGKVNIILGPLTPKQLAQFTPHTSHMKALNELVRLYLGFEHDYRFTLRIHKKDIPRNSTGNRAILGWTSWLSNKNKSLDDPYELVDIPISVRS